MVVLPGLLGTLDPFSLSLPDDVPLKLCERSQHLKEELGERVLCAMVLKGQSLLEEFHDHTLGQQRIDQVLKILKATGKPVDGVYPERVAFAQVLKAFLEGRTVGILATRLIFKNFSELLRTLRGKLPVCVLVCAAYSKVGYVSGHGSFSHFVVE